MKMKKLHVFIILAIMTFLHVGTAYAAGSYVINNKTIRFTDFSSSPGECWAYANNVYNRIWGTSFSSEFSDSNNMLRNLSDNQLLLNPDNLKKYISCAPLGASLRICNAVNLHSHDGYINGQPGHNQIIVQKDANGFTVVQGGLSASPHCNEQYYTWSGYCNTSWLGGTYHYIKYIKWPNAQPVSSASSISISGANTPGTLHEGNVFSISGTVSSNQSLTKVTAGVYDLNDVQKTGKSASPYTTSYNIKGLDNEVYFNHLSAGVYRYKVIASTASKTETLVSKVFIILGNKQTIANGTYNFCSKGNTNLGLSISDNSHASGANVLLWENTASNNYMKWQVKYVSDGYYEIKNVATGLALDVKSAADANNANVHQYAANASIAQLWNFVPMGSYYCLVPKCATGRCLDVSEAKFNNGTNIQLWEANLNNAQLWKFSSTSKYTNKTVSIASAQITGLGNKVWTGKKLVPSLGVTVAGTKLVKGTHYTVSCTNNVNVGTAKITIKGKGKYTGSLTKSFKIIPRTTSVTVSKGKKRFIARWKLRIPQTSGYELQYSTNRSFKSFFKYITISNNLTLSKNVTNLKSKTTYYVRIRTYKLVGSKKYYSNWSKTVTVKPT